MFCLNFDPQENCLYGEDVKLVSEGACSCDCSYRLSNQHFRRSFSVNVFFRLSPGTSYKWGGCKITSAPPAGFVCECKKVRLFVEMNKNTEEKTNSRLGLDRVQRPHEEVQSRRILPRRLHQWDLLQVCSQIKSIKSIALRSKVSKAEDYELNLFFLDEEEATAADTGALKTFLHIDLQSLGDKCATNHHHRRWHQLPNSKTSKSSNLGSRWAREELKKRKIIYIQFPRWWAH